MPIETIDTPSSTDSDTPSLSSSETSVSRRDCLRTVGYSALALFGASSILPSMVHADTRTDIINALPRTNLAPPRRVLTLPANVKLASELNKIDKNALRKLTAPRPLPGGTPITRMGLTSTGRKALTPKARQLTKGELVALARGSTRGRLGKLTVKDVKSIQVAFGSKGGFNPGSLAAISCCCCTPCCCAAATTEPVGKAA